MYNYIWDEDTGGYLLSQKLVGVIKEVRPVFKDELELLGFDKLYGWVIPNTELPLMWAEGRRYMYYGEFVGEAVGGGLYDSPILKSVQSNLIIKPVNVSLMVEKNKEMMDGVVQKTLKFIYNAYKQYQKRVGMFYIAFSSGKDSIVMMDLVQRALPHDEFSIVFGDTTMEVSDTYNAFKIAKERWNTLDWQVAKADFDAIESWNKIGYPARKLRWCCSVHKTAPSILKVKELYYKKHDDAKHFKVMVFDGIRAEESDARATYSMISEGRKHSVQYNCSPIFEWNTSELFLYMFEHNLFINDMYKSGSTRVGCKLCPMASNWNEFILNHKYSEELNPLLDILYNSINKDFKNNDDRRKYFQDGGWKSRIGGRELVNGCNKVTEIVSKDIFKIIINDGNYKWNKWLTPVGELIEVKKDVYQITYKDLTLEFRVERKEEITTLFLQPLIKTKSSIRFMYLFKNAIYKSAYCVNCKGCMAECSFDALNITSNDIEIKNCIHCECCLDLPKGCVVARSLGISGGGNNVSIKNLSRYQNFGYRQEWLKLYFELNDEFWANERMGKYMIIGFRSWLKESGITNDNAITELGERLKKLGSDSSLTWAIIYNNLAYTSPLINWYVLSIEFGREYQANDLNILLDGSYSPTTIKNSLSSLKETLRYSPIGALLGQGECELKGKTVTTITREGWSTPEPLAILYCLYKYAENPDSSYSFTLSNLYDEASENSGISPFKLYNIDKNVCKDILEILARDYVNFIKVNFNKDIMDDVYLNSAKTSNNVLELM